MIIARMHKDYITRPNAPSLMIYQTSNEIQTLQKESHPDRGIMSILPQPDADLAVALFTRNYTNRYNVDIGSRRWWLALSASALAFLRLIPRRS